MSKTKVIKVDILLFFYFLNIGIHIHIHCVIEEEADNFFKYKLQHRRFNVNVANFLGNDCLCAKFFCSGK